MTSRTVLDISAAALCATLAVSVGALTMKTYAVLDTAQLATQAIPGALDAAITREAARLDLRLESIERRADGRLASLQVDVRREFRQTRLVTLQLVDEHGIRMTAVLDAHIGQANSAIRELADAYAAVPADAKWATRQIWDCEANPDCLENRYVSVSRAVERASREVERTAPRIGGALERSAAAAELTAASSARTTDSAAKLMDNLERQTRPLPRGLAIALRILGPAAQVATPFVIGGMR